MTSNSNPRQPSASAPGDALTACHPSTPLLAVSRTSFHVARCVRAPLKETVARIFPARRVLLTLHLCTACASGPGSASTVAAGADHACAILDNQVSCWGANTYGQAATPVGSSDFVEVSASWNHTCALERSGQISCWGSDDYGETEVPDLRFTTVSAGANFSCGITESGEIVCWGDNGWEQATAPAGTYLQVSAGYRGACAVASGTSEVSCWGLYDWTAPSGPFEQVSVGSMHACALASGGAVTCWGDDDNGETTAPSRTFTQVSAGSGFSCGVTDAQEIECWGQADDDYGRADPPPGNFRQVAAGQVHACARDDLDGISCWGLDRSGQSSPP